MGARDIFSIRRPLDPPVGIPKDLHRGSIEEPHLLKLSQCQGIEAMLERDHMPIPSTRDREGYYGDRHFEYWLSGLNDYLRIKDALPGMEWRRAKLLDFGGATARVSRHFYAQEEPSDITICDVNINNVEWVLEYLPSPFGAFKNSVLPALPFADGYFDLITAFSVFTHIDEYELAWLYELRRILKPGGILYVTVHNDDTWKILPSTFVFNVLMQSEEFRLTYPRRPDLEERLVFRYSSEEVYNCNTFHPNAYIHRVWGRLFKVLEIRPGCHSYQSAVILKNDRPA